MSNKSLNQKQFNETETQVVKSCSEQQIKLVDAENKVLLLAELNSKLIEQYTNLAKDLAVEKLVNSKLKDYNRSLLIQLEEARQKQQLTK
jgi:hypothetical protein